MIATAQEHAAAPQARTAGGTRKFDFWALRVLPGMVPIMLLVGVFLLWPVVGICTGSLARGGGLAALVNYRASFAPQYLNSWLLTAAVSFSSAALGAIIGFCGAWSLQALGRPRLTLATVALASIGANFSGLPLALAFMVALSPGGFVTGWLLGALHISLSAMRFSLANPSGLVLVYAFFQAPLMLVLIYPTLEGIGRRDWLPAAQSLGANGPQAFWRVTLPVILPGLLGSSLLLVANAFGAYVTAYAIAGGTVNLLPIQLGYLINGNVELEPALADAIALEMLLALSVLLIVYQVLMLRARRRAAT